MGEEAVTHTTGDANMTRERKMTDKQKASFSVAERKRFGPWLVTVPHGPYNVAEHRKFVDSLPSKAEYHDCIEGVITGGNGVGWPGWCEEKVMAVYQPLVDA